MYNVPENFLRARHLEQTDEVLAGNGSYEIMYFFYLKRINICLFCGNKNPIIHAIAFGYSSNIFRTAFLFWIEQAGTRRVVQLKRRVDLCGFLVLDRECHVGTT
jgi:hypothetical protein